MCESQRKICRSSVFLSLVLSFEHVRKTNTSGLYKQLHSCAQNHTQIYVIKSKASKLKKERKKWGHKRTPFFYTWHSQFIYKLRTFRQLTNCPHYYTVFTVIILKSILFISGCVYALSVLFYHTLPILLRQNLSLNIWLMFSCLVRDRNVNSLFFPPSVLLSEGGKKASKSQYPVFVLLQAGVTEHWAPSLLYGS